MAKARVCDRCGIIVTDYFYDFTIYKNRIQNESRFDTTDINDFELCPDCMKELKTFIEGGMTQDNEFVFVIFDKYDENMNGHLSEGFRGIFDNLDQAKEAMERPIFKNFEWIDDTHYEYDGLFARHYGIIMSVPKNKLFYNIDYS